jgi:hypothetical protein
MRYSKSVEREFLGLAGTYLAARFAVMGGQIEDSHYAPVTGWPTLSFHLMGMVDYQWAMQNFIEKWRVNPNHSERYKP